MLIDVFIPRSWHSVALRADGGGARHCDVKAAQIKAIALASNLPL